MKKRRRRKILQETGQEVLPPGTAVSERPSVAGWKIFALCLLVFIVAFAVYANTIGNDFIWDDEYLIINNSQIKSFTHLGNVFKTYVGYGSENINTFYRPIQELSNMIDYFLWGLESFGFHLTNVLLHSLVSVMVFVFIFTVTGNLPASFVAAVFYSVHPVHTEAVAYVAGRADSLYSLFMLLSLVFFIRSVQDAPRGSRSNLGLYGVSLFFFILSFLSKEMGLIMPLLAFLYMFYFLRGTDKDDLYRAFKWRWAPYVLIIIFYGSLRATVLNFSDIAPVSAFVKIPFIYRILTFFRTLFVYFRLLIFPSDLHMERAISITRSVFNLEAVLALLMTAGIIWVAYKTYRSNKRMISFAIAWFFANLLPISNIVPINSFLAEHWIYMASIGPFMLLGLGLVWVWRKIPPKGISLKTLFVLAIVSILFLYMTATIRRNRDWKDEISFFHSTLKYHPRNARLYLNLGNTYYEKKEIDNAIEQYQKAISINKKYAVAYGNIGSAYLHKKNTDKAEEYLNIAIKLKYNYPIAHYNLGIVYFNKKRYEEATEELETATEQLPQLYQAWNMLARAYIRLGKVEEAREAFRRSLAIMPNQDIVRRSLKKLEKVKILKKAAPVSVK